MSVSLASKSSSAIVAVKDLNRARAFYEGKLGLAAEGEMDGVLTFPTGKTTLVVYESDKAGHNQGNAVLWDAGSDFDALVEGLRANGVAFEEYPEMGMDIADGVHSEGGFKAVWFKDPDGNILHINSV